MKNQVINLCDSPVNGFIPVLTTYIIDNPLEREQLRSAVLILPGGGYRKISPREGEPIALQFNAAGLNAFVLNYSVAPLSSYKQPLNDAAQAMRVIRENAENWGVDSNKIAVCGFSAGGHLAASLCAYGREYETNSTSVIPNAAILSYPVITSGEFTHKGTPDRGGSLECLLGNDMCDELMDKFSIEKHITSDFPPTFLWHTVEDMSVPIENSLMLMSALKKSGVSFEAHIYPHGGHGLSLARYDVSEKSAGVIPHVSSWIKLCLDWLDGLFLYSSMQE